MRQELFTNIFISFCIKMNNCEVRKILENNNGFDKSECLFNVIIHKEIKLHLANFYKFDLMEDWMMTLLSRRFLSSESDNFSSDFKISNEFSPTSGDPRSTRATAGVRLSRGAGH
jgi:hypothetical protein